MEVLVAELEEFPELGAHLEEPDIIHPPTPRSLTNLVDWCSLILSNMNTHDSHSSDRLHQLSIIQRSTTIALSNLLSHSASVRDTASTLEHTANKELSRMKGLLNSHETDLKILSLVHINPKLLSVPDPSKGKPKERTLGEYVSPSKMGAVYQACSNVHSDLEDNVRNLKLSETQMNEDTEGLRIEVQGTSIIPSQETYEESRQALERARQVHDLIMSHCLPDDQGWSAAAKLANDEVTMKKVDEAIGELILLDEVARESLRRLTADKNDMVSRSLHLLGDISGLQSDYADLGIELTQLDSEFKSSKIDGFRHLARLKNMLWAYGSTLIEIHRRKEFEDKFLIRSQALAEVMANLSENERKRRADFRSQVMGALPWEVKGMDENTPNLEISAGKSRGEEDINIGREDIDDLFRTLDFVEEKLLEQSSTTPIQEVKTALQQLVARLDEAEAEFVKLVEVGLLGKAEDESESEAESPNHRYARSSKNEFASQTDKEKLERELEDLKMQHGEKERALERAHDLEIKALRAEVSKLRADNRHLEYNLEHEKNQHEESRKLLESREADAQVEAARRINMEEEVSRLRKDCEDARRAEMESKAEANEEVERANDLEAHLHDLQIELEEAKDAKNDACNRIEALLDKDSSAEKQLSLAQERIIELSDQLSQARVEERKAKEAQYDTETARDKILRNYRAEADGDRAILEENLRSRSVESQEMKEKLRRKEKEIGELSDNVKILQGQLTAADEAHEELVRQLESNRETCLEAEMAKRQADRSLEAVLEKARPLMGRLIELHNTVRDMPPLSTSSSRNTSGKSTKDAKQTPSVSSDEEALKQQVIERYQGAADSLPDVDTILDLIGSLSKASLIDSAIAKLESLPTLVKKLNKAYKHLKDTSQRQQLLLREKITFRNFGLGDLALFLPTRNNSGKPWAAFNINFPHFFLNFSGRPENEQLKESLQNKEWIVARITKIESRIAASTKLGEVEVEGNPFQLAEGVKFYLLEVEGWNSANSNVATLSRRKSTSTALGNATSITAAANNSQSAAPAIKRWDSSPNPARHGQSTGKAMRNTLEDADDVPELPEEPSLGSPNLSTARDRSTSISDVANLSISLPVTEIVRDNTVATTISRASSPSGIALSLRNRSTSPEMDKNIAKSANEIVEAGFTRWPTVAERQQPSFPSNGTTSGITMAKQSSSESNRRGIEKTTPAFGRRKKTGPSSSSGAFGTAMLQSRSNASPPTTQARTGQQTIPIGMAERSLLRGNGKAEDSPNPFSASPAPTSTAPEMRDYFATRRQRTTSSLRPDQVKTPKVELATSHGSSAADDARNRRASSSSSILSNFKPIPLLGSPRVRASVMLSPSTEVAQGQHTLGQNTADGEPLLASTSYGSESSSAGRYSTSQTMALSRQTSTRRLPSSSSVSSWTSNWTLGRKSGLKVGDQTKIDDGPSFSTSASQSLRKLADGNSK